MDSVLEQLAAEMAGKAIVGTIQHTERELFKAYEIRGVPSFIIMHDSEVKQSFQGFREKASLARALNEYVK